MALQTLPAPIVWMPPQVGAQVGSTTSVGSAAGLAINGADDKVAFIFEALAATCPDAVEFYVSAYTSTGTIDCTIETVDTSGFPSGTAVSGSGTATKSVTGTGRQLSGTGIAGSASLTAGTLYALVLTAASGFGGSFTIAHSFGTGGLGGLPYALTKDSAGAWTRATGSSTGYLIGAQDSGGAYLYLSGVVGAGVPSYQTFSNSTDPDERGNQIVLPFACKIGGALVLHYGGSVPAAADACTVKLLSSVGNGDTPTEEVTFVNNGYDQGLSAGHFYRFTTDYTITINTAFGLTIKADSTDNMSLVRWDFTSNDALTAFLGTNFHAITRNSGGTVTNTSTQQAQVYGVFPVITALDDGAGGGGGGLAANPMRGFL